MAGREQDRECGLVLRSWLATMVTNDWRYIPAELLQPTDHENGSAVYTHDDSDISTPSFVSSFNFTLSILNLLMPYIGINK